MHPSERSSRTLLLALGCAASVLTACPPVGAAPAPQPGAMMYSDCTSCHGAAAEGSKAFGAPAIAGMPAWYLEAQLTKFRLGIRGSHVDDPEGLRMRAMSRQLKTDAEVRVMADYLSKLPPPAAHPSTLAGADAEAGKAAYAVCVACHGARGEGNQALNAPPLAGQEEWYLQRQLAKFRSGVRGTHPQDVTGQQMRPMALTLTDEQAVNNVVAYIQTLSR